MMLIKIKLISSIFIVAVVALLSRTAHAQSEFSAEDPVSKAIERIQRVADERAFEAERVVAASKFLDETAVARQQRNNSQAIDALKRAEEIAGQIKFTDGLSYKDLFYRIAAEQAALSPKEQKIALSLPEFDRPAIKIAPSIMSRFGMYKESFSRIFEQENVPTGLLAVAFVESGFNPLALSSKGARGIWQFMPSTARRYGLKVEPISDHRTNPEHSTRAAARYLRDLYKQFGDWKLALAAYNAGENRIQRIIDKRGIRNFDEMARRGYLPAETRNYVPAVLSVWDRFNFNTQTQLTIFPEGIRRQ
jgi:soluble lytic murein transglycosylase-like protein